MLAEATERGFVALTLSPSLLSRTSHPPASRGAVLLPLPLSPPLPSFWPSPLLLVAAKHTVRPFPTAPLHDVRYVAAYAILTVPLLFSRSHVRGITPVPPPLHLSLLTYHSVVSTSAF